MSTAFLDMAASLAKVRVKNMFLGFSCQCFLTHGEGQRGNITCCSMLRMKALP
jgi:hypothetical protein